MAATWTSGDLPSCLRMLPRAYEEALDRLKFAYTGGRSGAYIAPGSTKGNEPLFVHAVGRTTAKVLYLFPSGGEPSPIRVRVEAECTLISSRALSTLEIQCGTLPRIGPGPKTPPPPPLRDP